MLVAGTGAVVVSAADRDQGEPGLEAAGAAALAAGVAALYAAGIWMAARSHCDVDTDCVEGIEYCQKLYTVAGVAGRCVGR
jgi:hypothetical protein